ncbi:MAG: putative zinc-binding metallopeptidase [Steroidobacteraceae bacterium]|nr:putative zinc-binding metallopeptidase [Steroidobacteraceae bacterium]
MSTRSRRERRDQPAWAHYPDHRLLDVRLCDLGLGIEGTPVEGLVRRLYGELAGQGLPLRPHCWISLEWFSPDGVPGIALPFYLMHPRLKALHWRFIGEVEGGNARELMQILRHEAGHAIDTAWRLRRRRAWRETFGPASQPYPMTYRPRPGSRRYVQYLGGWYAQAHPAEDFAETFAVWLTPGSDWRNRYRGWPALAKLECVDRLMAEIRGQRPPVRSQRQVEPLSDMRQTLGQHYADLLRGERGPNPRALDTALRRLFVAAEGRRRGSSAISLLRRETPALTRRIAVRLDVSDYLVREVIAMVIGRCRALGLRIRGSRREALPRAERLIANQVGRTMRQRGPRLSL